MPRRSVVVIGASAGGVEALRQIVSGLPAGFPGTLLVVLHISADAPSVLPAILGRAGALPSQAAVDGELVLPGRIYVAPPDVQLIVQEGRTCLVRGPRENANRPAIDPLFRSAARTYGPEVIGVVLTGNLGDGTLGLAEVKAYGGLAVVQSPAEAPYPSMPRSAISHVDVDYVLPVAEIAPLLVRLVGEADAVARLEPRDRNGSSSATPDDVLLDGTAHVDASIETNEAMGGSVSHFTCPECHGTLWEIAGGAQVRYRCRVGHSFTEPLLLGQKEQSLETALWTAMTALEESASLAWRMARQAEGRERTAMASWFTRRAEVLEARSRVVRDVIATLPSGPLPELSAADVPRADSGS